MTSTSLGSLMVSAVAISLLAPDAAPAADAPKSFWVYVGSYTGEKSKGIYVSRLRAATGKLSPAELAVEVKHPSFLALHPSGKFLYAVSETADSAGKPSGAVSAFQIDKRSGKLALLNHQTSSGAGPCHLVVDKTGGTVLIANYGAGSVASIRIGADGKLGEVASAIQHKGSSINSQRQEGPHAHSINLDPQNKFAFCADLGLDQVLVYQFDPATGKLAANTPPAAKVEPGAGPRHFCFLPNGRFAYVINELSNTVTAFRYDGERGVLTTIQDVTTLPADFRGTSYTAEIVAHPSGKFVYGSNRGHDSIVMFAVEPESGQLVPLGQHPTGGKTPRNFAIDPTGSWLLAENQDSDTIVVLKIDARSGRLSDSGHKLDVPMPVCVKFLPAD